MFREHVRRMVLLSTAVAAGLAFCGLVWMGHLEAAEEDGQVGRSPTQVFLLGTQFHPGHRVETDAGRIAGELMREILRQGLLIAARDELGLPTRDATLREPFLDGSGKELKPLKVTTVARLDQPIQVRLTRGDGDKQEEIWRAEYERKRGSYFVYTDLIPLVEADSRTGVVAALRQAGYGAGAEEEAATSQSDEASEPDENSLPAEVPEEVQRQLSVMHFAPQFAAVRWAHKFNQEHGQTPASLSVLARGYAHLAMLSECYWNSMSRAYKARALLYAERMTVAYPDSSQAFWHRAYALTIIGIHGAALMELEEIADKFGEEEPPNDGLPGCMKLIKPCCRYDSQGLLAVGEEEGQLAPAAHFLNFRVTLAINDARLLVAVGQDALMHCPDTYEIYDAIAKTNFLGMMRWAAQAAPAAMSTHLPIRLKAVDRLPEAAKSLLSEDRDRLFGGGGYQLPVAPNSHRVAAALVDAGRVGEDSVEPSWDVLGRMIQEENFLACVQMMLNMRNAVQRSLADEVESLMPIVEGHPYASYLESFRVQPAEQPKEFAEILSDLRIVDPQFHMYDGFRPIWYVKRKDEPRGLGWHLSSACSRDFTAYSLLFSRRYGYWSRASDEYKQMIAVEFEHVSPHCPETLRTAIAMAREPTEEQLLEWEQRAAGFPRSLHTLGRAHGDKQRYEAAVRCMEKSIAVSPSVDAFQDLASIHEAQGKPELVIPTLKRYLEVESYGLNHGLVNLRIAYLLMGEQKWEEAKPHALNAAETYSSWGMICASRCYEGLEDWENSELWARRASESYGRQAKMTWYLWCRRNQRGDLEAARPLARQYVQSLSAAESRSNMSHAGVFHLIEGDRRKALESFREQVRHKPNIIICAITLLLAVEFEDRAIQDEMCQELKEFFEPAEDGPGELDRRAARLIEATLRSKDPQDPDLEAMAGIMKGRGESRGREYVRSTQANFGYVFGRILELDGQPEKAKEYFRQAVDVRSTGLNCCTFAVHALARLSKDEDP